MKILFMIQMLLATLIAPAVWGEEKTHVLIEPTGPYAGQMPHFDPLSGTGDEVGVLYIHDRGLMWSFETDPDWRDIDTTDAGRFLAEEIQRYHEWLIVKTEDQSAGGLSWDGAPISTCRKYLPLSLSVYSQNAGANGDDITNGSYCHARAALADFGVERHKLRVQNTFHNISTLEELFKFLPMAEFELTRGQRPQPMPADVGLPAGAHMVAIAESPLYDNVVLIEKRFDVDEKDADVYREQAMRKGNGLWCYPNRPCVCRFSANCIEYAVGLLAHWRDSEKRTHWLLYGRSRIDYSVGRHNKDYTRLYHVVREPGGKPKLDQSFLQNIPALLAE